MMKRRRKVRMMTVRKNKKKWDPQVMNTARQYEAHDVILWTMRHIKITKKKDEDKMEFYIMCKIKNYQPTNKHFM